MEKSFVKLQFDSFSYQEVEEYIEHVWKISNERLMKLEEEKRQMKLELDHYKNANRVVQKSAKESATTQHNMCDSLKLKSGFKQLFQK